MNEEILKWFLNNIGDRDLITLSKKMEAKVSGFSNIKVINNRLNVPRNLLIKSILNNNRRIKLKEYCLDDALSKRDYMLMEEIDIIKLFKEGKEQKYIIEFFIASKEKDYEKLKEVIIHSIKSQELNLFEKINLVKKSDNHIDVNKINDIIKKENEKLKEENKNLNKKNNILNEDNHRLNKFIELNEKKFIKIKNDFSNLKKKYDEIKAIEKELNKKNMNLNERNERLEKNYTELEFKNLQLKKIIEKKNQILKKKVAVIGDVNNDYLSNNSYEVDRIEMSDLEHLNNLLNDYEEIWILLYDLSILQQRKVKDINSNKIFKFKNFLELNIHISE